MNLENALLTALTAVTSGLVYVCRLMWVKQEQCEKDRYELREEIEEMKSLHGVATGTLNAVRRCPVPGCMFRDPPGSLPGLVYTPGPSPAPGPVPAATSILGKEASA
ncbi:hypothetical protein [Verrucomicrobium sp. BvORR034]|uniref:hypothetical protein n=1 Tax=Verrucomicrobium sp. BvORR034 TaxID=1396418 RepID=UPI0006790544|nr:hypothetical protein [Verrucomicrobium sp. BvORR034]